MEQHLGFIRDILDVKMLILFVMAQLDEPVDAQTIYELCYQDDSVSYIDVKTAIPQMVSSGHLHETKDDLYEITEKGREAEEVTRDGIAFPVMQRAKAAVERLKRHKKRDRFLRTDIQRIESGEYSVRMGLDDLQGTLMNLELMMPSLEQARKMERAFRKNAELVYQSVMVGLLEEAEKKDTEN